MKNGRLNTRNIGLPVWDSTPEEHMACTGYRNGPSSRKDVYVEKNPSTILGGKKMALKQARNQ